MFGWTVTFLLIAIVAGIFGFAGDAGSSTWLVKLLFGIGLAVFLALLVAARRPPNL